MKERNGAQERTTSLYPLFVCLSTTVLTVLYATVLWNLCLHPTTGW